MAGILRTVLTLAAGALVALGPRDVRAMECGTRLLTAPQVHKAIDFAVALVRESHYVPTARTNDRAVSALIRVSRGKIRPMTSAMLAHRMNVALAVDHDAHLRVELSAEVADHCPALPLALAWTDDGLLVLGGGRIPAGARILSIGDRSLAQLETLAAKAVPHENLYWVHSVFAREIVRADVLRSFGLVADDGSVEIVYQRGQDAPVHLRLRLSKPLKQRRPWVGYKLFKGDSTGLFWLKRCDPNKEFFDTLAQFVAKVKQYGLRKVVIDLRGNPGGNSAVAIAILRSLGLTVKHGFSADVRVSLQLVHDEPMFAPAAIAKVFQAVGKSPPPADASRYRIPGPVVLAALSQELQGRHLNVVTGRRLYLLIDGGTFSSASLFALLVRDNCLGTIIGEPDGNSTPFDGSEIEGRIPATPYLLHVPTARLVRPRVAAGPAPTLLPDIRAPLTAEALATGRDDALELVRNDQVSALHPAGCP